MKKLLFLLMLVVLQIDFLTASTFRNNNSIYIDNTIYDNLKSIGFDDDDILYIDFDTYEYYKDKSGYLISDDTKYYLTITAEKNNQFYSNSINNLISYTYEISKEDFENENFNYSLPVLLDVNPSTIETNAKKLETKINYIPSTNRYKIQNKITWKNNKMPKNRSYENFGIRLSDGIQPVSGSKFGYVYYSMYNTCLGTNTNYSTNLSSNGTWKYAADGYAVSFNLPKNSIYSFNYDPFYNTSWKCTTVSPSTTESSGAKNFPIELNSLSLVMVYEIVKTYSTTLNAISAFGSYQHSVKNISLNTALNFTIGNGIGGVFVMTASVKENFDQMGGTHAQLIGINW